jgi:hypothetical protein
MALRRKIDRERDENRYSSWGDMVFQNRQESMQVPWKPEQQEPVHYVTRHHMSRKEREFDPVLQQYRDPERQQSTVQSEHKANIKALNEAKGKQVLQGQCFDIVNHAWKLQNMGAKQFKQKLPMPESRVGYNILSNQDFPAGHPNAVYQNQQVDDSESPRQVEGAQQQRSDYNIISNQYLSDHETRTQFDQAASLKQASARFWDTHDFDPVACRYYDPEKEVAEKEADKQQEAMVLENVKRNLERMPPCLRQSEGTYYNIVSMRPKDDERILELDSKTDNSNSKRCMRGRIERNQQMRATAQSALEHSRLINRTTSFAQRNVYGYENGYNIVNHRPFQGRGRQELPKMEQSEPPSLWTRMQQGRGQS